MCCTHLVYFKSSELFRVPLHPSCPNQKCGLPKLLSMFILMLFGLSEELQKWRWIYTNWWDSYASGSLRSSPGFCRPDFPSKSTLAQVGLESVFHRITPVVAGPSTMQYCIGFGWTRCFLPGTCSWKCHCIIEGIRTDLAKSAHDFSTLFWAHPEIS